MAGTGHSQCRTFSCQSYRSYQQSLKVCVTPATCNNFPGELPGKGSSRSLAWLFCECVCLFVTIFLALSQRVWCAVGFLIFWRRSDDWLALLAAFFLVMFNLTASGNTIYALAFAYPVLALPLSLVSFLGLVSLACILSALPNGRFVPRWMGLILLLVIINAVLSIFPSITSLSMQIGQCGSTCWCFCCLWSHHLFANLSLQTRVHACPTPTDEVDCLRGNSGNRSCHRDFVLSHLLPKHCNFKLFGWSISLIVWPLALLLIPLSIGFSILRYRLYDIDVLINRTLVYGTLTACWLCSTLVSSLPCNPCCGE